MSFAEALEGHPVIFLGAGMSASMGYPTATELIEDLKPTQQDWEQIGSLDDIIEKMKNVFGRPQTIEILRKYVKGGEVEVRDNPYFLLKKILDKIGGEFTIVTTNWDLEVDRAFGDDALIVRTPEDFEKSAKHITVVKLHGDLDRDIVLDSKEAEEWKEKRERMYLYPFGESVKHPVILLGYSARDPDFGEWAKKARDSVELAVVLSKDDLGYPVKDLVVGIDVVDFLKNEATKLGVEIPDAVMNLEVFQKIRDAARKASSHNRSLMCFAPRLSGKSIVYERIKVEIEGLFSNHHDIGPSGDHNETLLEIIDELPKGGFFVTASPYAVNWATSTKGVNLPDCDLFPITISYDEARSILRSRPESNILKASLEANNAELEKLIIDYAKAKFKLGGVEGTTYRPPLIRAHLRHLAGVRSRWTKSEQEFRSHAIRELGKKSEKIEELAGVSLVSGADAAVMVAGPAATAAGLFLPGVAIALASVPILHGIVSRLRGKEMKMGELVDLSKFWEDLEPEEREVFSERIDEKRKYVPGTTYRNLSRVLGDKDFAQLITRKLDEWLGADKNRLRVETEVVRLLEEDKRFRSLMESVIQERWETLAIELNAEMVNLRQRIDTQDRRISEQEQKLSEVKAETAKSFETFRAGLAQVAKSGQGLEGVVTNAAQLGIIQSAPDAKRYLQVVQDGEERQVELVTSGGFGELIEEVSQAMSRDSCVVVHGKKGAGKSVLVRCALATSIDTGDTVLDLAKVGREQIRDALLEAHASNRIVLYDPSPPEIYANRELTYGEGTEYSELEEIIPQKLTELRQSRCRSVVVLSDDLFERYKRRLSGLKTIEIVLKTHAFVKNLIAAYAPECQGIKEVTLDEIASQILELDGSYALVAVYVALWLKSNNCQTGQIKEILTSSIRRPLDFLKFYIWHGVLKGSSQIAKGFAGPLLTHVYLGNMTQRIAYCMAGANVLDVETIKWSSVTHEDLVEKCLESFLDDAFAGTTLPGLEQVIIAIREKLGEFLTPEELQHVDKKHIRFKVWEFVGKSVAKTLLDSGVTLASCRNYFLSLRAIVVLGTIGIRIDPNIESIDLPRGQANMLKEIFSPPEGLPTATRILMFQDALFEEAEKESETRYCERLKMNVKRFKSGGLKSREEFESALLGLVADSMEVAMALRRPYFGQDIGRNECLANALDVASYLTRLRRLILRPFGADPVYILMARPLVLMGIGESRSDARVANALAYYFFVLTGGDIEMAELPLGEIEDFVEFELEKPTVDSPTELSALIYALRTCISLAQGYNEPIQALSRTGVKTNRILPAILRAIENPQLGEQARQIVLAEVGPALLRLSADVEEKQENAIWEIGDRSLYALKGIRDDFLRGRFELLSGYLGAHHYLGTDTEASFGGWLTERMLDRAETLGMLGLRRGKIQVSIESYRDAIRVVSRIVRDDSDSPLRELATRYSSIVSGLMAIKNGIGDLSTDGKTVEAAVEGTDPIAKRISVALMFASCTEEGKLGRLLERFSQTLEDDIQLSMLIHGILCLRGNASRSKFTELMKRYALLYSNRVGLRLAPAISFSLGDISEDEALRECSKKSALVLVAEKHAPFVYSYAKDNGVTEDVTCVNLIRSAKSTEDCRTFLETAQLSGQEFGLSVLKHGDCGLALSSIVLSSSETGLMAIMLLALLERDRQTLLKVGEKGFGNPILDELEKLILSSNEANHSEIVVDYAFRMLLFFLCRN